MSVYCFDIDATIGTFTDGDYEKAIPFKEVIKKVNGWQNANRDEPK